jgi:iron complex transport system permease protein
MATEQGGGGVGGAANAFDFVPALMAAGVLGAAGALTVRGRLPRFGMAAVAAFGAVSAGQLLQAFFLYQGGRTSRDLPLPVAMVRSFLYEPSTGLHLRVAAHALAVLALLLVLRSWPRTWMEDDGSFDPLRPRFGAVSLFAGFVAAAGVSIPAGDSDFPTLGPQSLIGRFGLDAWGTAILAAVLLVAAVVAPSLRPRLAAVGMYVGLAAATAAQAAETVLFVTRADGLHANLGTALPVVAAVAFAALAVGAWRMSQDGAAADDE